MATRFYFRAAEASAVAPTVSATWTNTANDESRRLATTKSAGDSTTATGNVHSWTAGDVTIFRQHVSDMLLGGQSLAGTVSCILRAYQGAAEDNVETRLGIRVVSGDGTVVRATLLAVDDYRGGEVTHTNASPGPTIFANAEALASYTTQPGDRIVVETGFTDVSGTTPAGTMTNGSSSALDYDLSETVVPLRDGWIEFSADLEFLDGSGVANTAERGPDTVFFGYSPTAGAALATDLSGNADNWTHDTTWIYESSHNEEALRDAFSVEMGFTMDNTSAGHLFSAGGGEGTNLAMVADAGDLDFYVNGAFIGAVATGVQRTVTFSFAQWSMEDNPLTTGASNAKRHDVRFFNADTGAWAGGQFTSPALAAGPFDGSDDTVFGARLADGTDAYSDVVRMARLSTHHHPPKELERCFLSVSAAPTPYGVTRLGWPLIRHTDAAWADDGYFAGPPHIWAAKSTHRNDLRLWGPLINERYTGAITSDEPWELDDVPSGTYLMHLSTLRRRPVPPGCDRMRVRFYVENNAGSGRITVRSYLSDRPGWLVQPGPSPMTHTYDMVTASSVDAGQSGWRTLNHTIVPQDADGYTYHFFAINDTTGSSNHRILAASLEPVLYSGAAA